MINPELRAKDRIFKELPKELRELMEKYVLPEEVHKDVLEKIKEELFFDKDKAEKPKFIIVAGQTGSGKSNLTSYICSNDNNLVVIDSDKFKAYRPDNSEIMQNYMDKYAYLTAPDSYLHRDEIVVEAIKQKYNILMECAPSQKEGLFVDINKIIESGYEVEIHVLGVGLLNSMLSVHERYEKSLLSNSKTAKLTSLDRHADSYDSLATSIMKEQNKDRVSIFVYKRGEKDSYEPIMVYDSNKDDKYSCPAEALIDTQIKDNLKTIPEARKRYEVIEQQMEERNAPESQRKQLEDLNNNINMFMKIEQGRG